jgi:hypothetical protein
MRNDNRPGTNLLQQEAIFAARSRTSPTSVKFAIWITPKGGVTRGLGLSDPRFDRLVRECQLPENGGLMRAGDSAKWTDKNGDLIVVRAHQ